MEYSDYHLTGSLAGLTNTVVTATCNTGYSNNGAGTTDFTCTASGIFEGAPCTVNACTSTTVPNSNAAADESVAGVTGDIVQVACDEGYSGGGAFVCSAQLGEFEGTTCTANSCLSTQVANSNFAETDSIAGVTAEVVAVQCNDGFSGSGDAICGTDGMFTTVECSPNPCTPAEVQFSDRASTSSLLGAMNDVVVVVCDEGESLYMA